METAASAHWALGLLLLGGLFLGRLASRFGLPRVVAYVTAGALFSPGLLGAWLGVEIGDWARGLTEAALGIIAYVIGGSITVGQLRRTGRVLLGTALGESLGAVMAVFLVMLLILPDTLGGLSGFELALAFGAIAAPTAPAATVAVLHQYHARGPFSSILLGVVALDDALGIMLFALLAVFVSAGSLTGAIGHALIEIFTALCLGYGGGHVLSRMARRFHQSSLQLPLVLGAVLLVIGASDLLGGTPLLAALTLGFTARAASGAAGERLFAPVEFLEELVFLVFFTLAGAMFEPRVLGAHLDLILAYFLGRILGKLVGAGIGARLSGAPPQVCRWLGFGLVPQAGVAVGLALTLSHHPGFEQVSAVFLNVVLGSTLLYELSGPLTVRFALARAGELGLSRKRRNGQ